MGGSSTSTQKSEPSDFIKPYLSQALNGAQEQYNKGAPQYYQDSTVPKDILAQTQNYALNSQANRAGQMAGSNYALNELAHGDLGDWGTVNQMRGLGAANNYGQDQGAANIMARMGNGTDLAQNLYNRTSGIVANGGGVGDYSQGAVGDITATGGGSNSQIRSDVRDIITGQAQGLNPAMMPLMDTANGGYLNSNPYLDQTFSKAADSVRRQYQTSTAPGVDMEAAGHGRYGSGLHYNRADQAQENLGTSLGNLATSIYGGNYANERQNQLSAANSLGSLYNSGLGLRASTAATSADQANRDAALRLQATGQIANDKSGDLSRMLQASNAMTQAEQGDLNNFMSANDRLSQAYNTGADRQISALNSANNMYNAGRAQQLQALGMQPQYLAQQQQMDYNDLGQAQEAAQTGINADIARWDYGQNAGRNNVNWYMNAINGMPGGSTSSVTQQGGMGGIGAGASTAANLAMLAKMFLMK